MNLEDQLRTTLRDRAGEDALQPDLWASITSGVRRDQRRRRTLVALAAAAVVATSVTVPMLLHDRGADEPKLPTATATATVGPPVIPAPIFPLRPTWLPPDVPAGVGNRTITQMGPNVRLEYERGTALLVIEVGPLTADWETEATDEHSAEIHGRTAEVHLADTFDGAVGGDRFAGVRWKLADGRWVSVLSWGHHTEADVLRIARGLAGDRLTTDDVPFRLAFVPTGLVPQHQSPTSLCLAPPRLAAEQRQPSGLCVNFLQGEQFDQGSASETWSVGGRRVAYEPTGATVLIEWGGDTQFELTWDPTEILLSHDDVVRFADGLRLIHR